MFRKIWLAVALLFLVGCRSSGVVDASAPDASVLGLKVADAGQAMPRATSLFGDGGRRVGAAFGAVGGDLAGYMPEPTIAKIDGINLPAPSGTSTVLTYGGGALSWALPPAAGDGGAGVVWANDLVGSTNSAQYIAAISGQGGSTPNVPVSATSFTWGTTGSLIGNTTIKGILTESDSSANKLWQLTEIPGSPSQPAIYAGSVTPGASNWAFNANSSATGVNGPTGTYLNVGGSPSLGALSGSVRFFDSSASTMWQLQYVPSTSIPAIYPVGVTPSSTNYTIASNTSATLVNAPGASANLDLETNGVVVESMSSAGLVTLWDTAGNKTLQFAEIPATTNGAIFPGGLTPSSGNYALACNASETLLNSGGLTGMGSQGTSLVGVGQAGISYTPSPPITVSGASTVIDLTTATGNGYCLYPTLVLTGNITGVIGLTVPNVIGRWTLDLSNVTFSGGSLGVSTPSGGGGPFLHNTLAGSLMPQGMVDIMSTGAPKIISSWAN